MKNSILAALFVLANTLCQGQTIVKIQTGAGYLEHFSIGPTLEWNSKNALGIYYGSNFFYKPRDFSTGFVKYTRSIPSLEYKRVMPGLSVKAGYTIFTDTYYTWKVISGVPMISLRYAINNRVDLLGETGLTFSRIESVKRVSYGEIGKYKRYLPELSLSLNYVLSKSKP